MSSDEDPATQAADRIGDERVAGAYRRHQSGQSKARQSQARQSKARRASAL